MTNSQLIEMYKADIKKHQEFLARRLEEFNTGEYKNCKKYPSYMREEMFDNFNRSDLKAIAEYEKLILDLDLRFVW